MPGIAGIIGKRPAEHYRDDVAAMIDSMRHDLSYVSETRVVAGCSACFGWIAHCDSYASRSSGSTADGLTLAFAGECFASVDGGAGSDEPPNVLAQYRRAGPSFVAGLNGLFSGLLVDSRREVVLLFNDRYGSERLYYHVNDEAMYFASEAKALLTVVPGLRVLDPDGVAQYLAFGSTQNGTTLFKGIRLVPGGSLWTMEPGRPLYRERYFKPAEWEAQSELTEDAFESEFVETAHAVFPKYAKATSKVGISITGGLDTRMLMACLPRLDPKPVCYTYGALSGETLDVSIGRRVAEGMGLEHHTLRVTDAFVRELPAHIDRTVFVTDGCKGALGAHELFLSTQARSLAPVRLTGIFGSEILRSVSTLKPLNLDGGLVNRDFAPRVRKWRDADRSAHPLTRTAFREVPLHLFGLMAAGRAQLTFRTPYLDNALVKLAYRAPLAARRSPSVALRLIATGNDILGRIPTDRGYSCGQASPLFPLRRLLSAVTFKLDYYDKEGLPPQLSFFDSCRAPLAALGLLGLHKFLPYRLWFRHELADYIADVLQSVRTRQQPWWNSNSLVSIGVDHACGRRNRLHEIDAVLTLDAVERTLIHGLPRRSARHARTLEVARAMRE